MLLLKIEGGWEPEDFIEVLQAVESLYYKVALRRTYLIEDLLFERRVYWRSMALPYEDRLDAQNLVLLKHARMLAPTDYRLRINRIEYASPGGIDLVGLGRAMEGLEKLVGRLLDYFGDRHLRKERDAQAKIETEKEFENLRTLKIENAERLLRLRREFGEDIDDVLLLLAARDQDALVSRIAEKKIVGIERES